MSGRCLPTIQVPTLVIASREDTFIDIRHSRYLADHIPGAAATSSCPGEEAISFGADSGTLLDEIEEFLTGARRAADAERILATVMFSDIVDSTQRAAELGDRRWRDLLETIDSRSGRELERFRGREVKTMGDGFLATFDGPARAIRCATAIRDARAFPVRAGDPQRPAHGRDRGDRRRRRRDRRPHRRPRRRQRRLRARCSSRARSRISWWDRGSRSRTAASASSRACPASGACGPWRHSFFLPPAPAANVRRGPGGVLFLLVPLGSGR